MKCKDCGSSKRLFFDTQCADCYNLQLLLKERKERRIENNYYGNGKTIKLNVKNDLSRRKLPLPL
jgi:predicted DCC family thiol-disulfide oxidoreductase YuxK